jgi:hypothetical protein
MKTKNVKVRPTKNKVKIIITMPRCVRCRERAYEEDIDTLLEVIRRRLMRQTGKNIPIQFSLMKV